MTKVVIVDDSNIIRNQIERIINSGGQQFSVVGTAKNGKEALEICTLKKPDVVTMDLTMPEMDGIECIEQLVAISDKIHILVVSALSDKATAIEALQKGAHGFLCKPFSEEQLQEALTELVSKEL